MIPHQITSTASQPTLQVKPSVNGLHIVSNFTVQHAHRLQEYSPFKSFIDLLIDEFKLSKIGEIYHNFEDGGFTGVVCLTESHLSVHTYPEHYYLTFDVFLTNHLRFNQPTAHALYHSVKHFFNATVSFEQFINR